MAKNSGVNRRDIIKASALALGGRLLVSEPLEAYPKAVNTSSSPTTLKITDMRVATVVKPGPSPCPIIRIDTNQGVYGLGEVRDGASATYALFLKSRIVGENPLQLDSQTIPVIASFNGSTASGWTSFAKQIQQAGADALELNLYNIPTDQHSHRQFGAWDLELFNPPLLA